MIVFRRRLIFWLIKAYIKKSGKTLIISFLLGLLIFFGLLFVSKYFVRLIPIYKKVTIGLVGAYNKDNLPPIVVSRLSRGLTSVAKDGTIKPDIASKWKVLDNGKTYYVSIKHDLYFNDGREVTSSDISYNFTDVTIEKPDKYTIVFKLKDAYAPFLATLSRPVVEKGSIGVGDYRVEDIKLNGDFIQSMTLVSAKDKLDTIRYQFYPTEEALKMAYLLGEVSHAVGLSDVSFKDNSFDTFANTTVRKISNYSHLVTLFFNTADSELSDKKVRLGLTYALPDQFPQGQKAYSPYSPESIFLNTDVPEKKQDYTHAKLLLSANGDASGSATMQTLTIKTLKKYRKTAEIIAASWKNIGLKTNIEEVDSVPDNFQIFLGEFSIPKDPDQYTLWHSQQRFNITKYKNLRIDKLLEDGRKTVDLDKRKEIYADFQKYLLEDAPAAFLYFPREYDVVRK